MKKILLAVHGGRTAEGAAHVAHLLSERTSAPIEAVAVLEPPPMIDYGYAPVYVPDAETDQALANELLSESAHQLELSGIRGVTPVVLRGPSAACISSAARASNAGLIVVGIGPHHLTDRALGGETALHLAQSASTPVLAVPATMRSLPRRIVAAVDFSAASLAAVRVAASLLTADDTLELVHVGAAARVHGSAPAAPPAALVHRLKEVGKRTAPPNGVHVVTTVLTGAPARTLLDHAQHVGADVVALGSHGYTPWQRLVLGSVSSKVLRLAQCAVLVYPARCAAAAAPDAAPTAA